MTMSWFWLYKFAKLFKMLIFISQFILEERGCPMFCSTMSSELLNNQLMVATNDAIYAYQSDARGSCFAFDGKIFI